MNFKTTVVLLALLVVAFGALWLTRAKKDDSGGTAGVEDKKQKLFDVAAADVNKLVVVASDGKRLAIEKSGAKWRMTEPVNAPAEAFEVDSLVRAITELESRGKVSGESATAEATGLAKPKYVVDLSTSAGKTYTLNVGQKPAVGDIVYVARKDQPGETLVVLGDLLEKLDKPATDFRDKKLVDVSTGDVRQITIEKGDERIVISRKGTGDWNITEPKQMPAEKSEVDDIVFGVTGLRAVEYVSENATADAANFGLDKPRVRVTVSSTQPVVHTFVTTAPSTTQATTQNAPVVVNLGRFDDVLKKNVYASTSQSPVIAKVSANIIETINKRPIELRDKKVFDVDAAQVSSITITSDLAATTQPTSRPASKKEVVIQRAKAPAATTQATTGPATTQASTQASTKPATTWEVVDGKVFKPADDAKVDSLLTQLHPLRAQKYLENPPATQPTATYVVRITTVAAGGAQSEHELKLIDPGSSQPLRGTYNDLAFEADRFFVDRLSGDFVKGSSPSPSGGLGAGTPGHDSDAAPFPTGP